MKGSQHWYDRDGKAVFEVPKAKGGGTRPTTIADARKLGLYPSVTTVLSVLAKPQLVDWQLNQVAAHAYSNPPQDAETPEDYARRIISSSQEQVGEAADLGTKIHAAIEAHFKGEAVAEEMQVYVRPTVTALKKAGIKLLEHELRLVHKRHGFAGTTDAIMEHALGYQGVLDFKSRKTKPGQPCEPWETEPMQIAAYSAAKFGEKKDWDTEECILINPYGANVYISTTEPGRVEIVQHNYKDINAAWRAFRAALEVWQYLKGYKPPA